MSRLRPLFVRAPVIFIFVAGAAAVVMDVFGSAVLGAESAAPPAAPPRATAPPARPSEPPAKPTVVLREHVAVTTDGAPLDLHDFGGGAFGLFEVAKPVAVAITPDFTLRWVDVRPRSAGVRAVIDPDHRAVRFTMTKPAPLTVEFNGDVRRVIHLFGYAPEKDPPRADADHVRYFGPGVHQAGIIELQDGETIYLAPGAWVKGAIRAHGKKNVTIRGRGVLDADGLDSWLPPLPPPPPPDPTVAGAAQGQRPRNFQRRPRGSRNVIYLEKTEAAKVEGITLLNAPTWTFFLYEARDTHVDGLNILSYGACGTDGIDIVSSSGTLVENTFIRANDDNIAIKNLADVDTKDITVRHSVFWNMPCGNAMEIGFETRGAKTEHVVFQDIDVIHVERGAAISIHHGDNGTIEDVLFDDIRVEDAKHKLIDFAIVYGVYGPDRPTQEQRRAWNDVGGAWDAVLNVPAEEKARVAAGRGTVRNVRVRNLNVVEGDLPYSIVAGFSPDKPLENVVIEKLRYRGRPLRNAVDARMSVSDVKGLVFK